MIEKVRKYPVALIIFLSFFYLVGVVGLSAERTRPVFQALVPFTLLFSLYFLWLFHEQHSLRFYITCLEIFLLGFLVEVAGVNTGLIFGEYFYGRTLGVKIWNTPLMIGVNWLLLIYTVWVLTGFITGNRWLRYALGGLAMVMYDIFLEPVAIRIDMWNWHGADVPLQNYLAWFVVSVILLVLLDLNVKNLKNKIAPSLFIIQIVFFVLLNIVFYYI
jgi:putative membrane protein